MYGTKRVSIDAKQRLTLPAEFRKEFSDRRVLIVPFNNECLYGFTPENYEAWIEGYFNSNGRQYDERNPEDRKLMRQFRGNVVEISLDSAGRLALGRLDVNDEQLRPGKTPRRVRMGIEGDVIVIGNVNRFEIWSLERWMAEQDDDDE